MVCARTAWLELPDGSTMALEDEAAGYFCTQLDLGWPDVRAVTASVPNASGLDDTTSFLGGRNVSANISALVGAGATIDQVAAAFGAYMMPTNRPFLHYVLERPGNPERVLGPLRGNGYAWPIAGDNQRDIQLQWVASDPNVYDPTEITGTAWFGTPTAVGRVYNLVFDRTYGNQLEAGPTNAFLRNDGDVPASPLLVVYGPVSGPTIYFGTAGHVYTTTAFQVDAGAHVTIDTAKHLAYMGDDPEDSVISWLNFQATAWPVLPPHTTTTMFLNGADFSHVSQVSAMWRNGFLE